MTIDKSIFDDICVQIAEGKSLRQICAQDGMPSGETIRRWLAADEAEGGEMCAQYARAREAQADYYADEIIEIADTATDAQIARLQVDARKWKASKLAPKRYGEKVSHEHGGEGGGSIPLSLAVTFVKSSVDRPS